MSGLDQIKIQNLEVFGHHGVFQEETALGQKFLVNAILYTDTRKAGLEDDLLLSVHYGDVCHFITKFMQEHTYKLIEAAAEHLAQAMLMEFGRLHKVSLEIKKPWAPIGLPIETVSVQIERGWHTVSLSVGSNMGDRKAYVEQAVEQLCSDGKIRQVKVSEWIETEPYGYTDQEPFLNGAILLQTLYTPWELLQLLHEIEQNAGRERKIHWGPRTLDLDIVFYDDLLVEEPDLTIPHPDMQNRKFVLEPLAQLCPGKVHPVQKKTVLQMLKELQ